MPGRAIYGTVARYVNDNGADNPEQDNSVSFTEWMLGILDIILPVIPADGPKELAKARKEFFEANGYYPPYDPRKK